MKYSQSWKCPKCGGGIWEKTLNPETITVKCKCRFTVDLDRHDKGKPGKKPGPFRVKHKCRACGSQEIKRIYRKPRNLLDNRCLHCGTKEFTKPKDSSPKRKSGAAALILFLIGPILSLIGLSQT